MASGQEKDMAREEGPTAPNKVVNNAAEIELNQDEAMADIELDDIENLDLEDEDNYVEAVNHVEANNNGEEDDTGEKGNTGDENDFTEGEGMSYPISEEIFHLQAKVSTQNITIQQQQKSIDGLTKLTNKLKAELGIVMKEQYAVEFEAAARMLQKPLSDEEMMHTFMKGHPVKLQQAHVTGGMTNWTTYKEMKKKVIKTNLLDTTMTLVNVSPEARVTAATRAFDEVACRTVYGAKKQAQGPFEWPEFCTALKEAFMVKKSDLELRGRLESIKCRDRSVQQYAVEFEAASGMLQKPLSDEEMMHTFMKSLLVKLQQAHVTGGMTNWTTYKEMKEQVIKTDNIIRTYMFGPEKPGQRPCAEGSGGHGNRPQNANRGGSWNKRPFQQRDHQPGPQAKKANGGGAGRGPNNMDFSKMQCNGCGRIGHIQRHCRDKNSIKYYGKPKPGGAGPSRKKDFHKPN
ncbi:unnamed protein product [Closterium sp. Naga37s-1]|nr:unnamed protein product [Closterium sp. Naga37s-1]